jgi:ketosteroid isomerase-like protein
VQAAASGDLAVDMGRYRLSTVGPSGPVAEAGKYVTTFVKDGDAWKIVYDIFNSDEPVPAASAVADTS